MTAKQEWKMAKWIKRHGKTKIADLPRWFGDDFHSEHNLFSIEYAGTDTEGYPILSNKSSLYMTDRNIDTYRAERMSRIHEFRDWLEPTGVVVANIIAIIAIIISIIALNCTQ